DQVRWRWARPRRSDDLVRHQFDDRARTVRLPHWTLRQWQDVFVAAAGRAYRANARRRLDRRSKGDRARPGYGSGVPGLRPCASAVASRMLGLSRSAFIWKMGLPSALPDILAGLRVSVSIALILSVLGEMLAGQPGLGQTILLSARSFRSYDTFAGLILL